MSLILVARGPVQSSSIFFITLSFHAIFLVSNLHLNFPVLSPSMLVSTMFPFSEAFAALIYLIAVIPLFSQSRGSGCQRLWRRYRLWHCVVVKNPIPLKRKNKRKRKTSRERSIFQKHRCKSAFFYPKNQPVMVFFYQKGLKKSVF